MYVRRAGLCLAFIITTTLVFSSVAFSATRQLPQEAAIGMRAMIKLAYGGNTTEGEPVARKVPAVVTYAEFCGTVGGIWKCWGESQEVCPGAIAVTDMDTGQLLECEVECNPSTPVNGMCDCDMVSCS